MRLINRAICALAIIFLVAGLGAASLKAGQSGNGQKRCPVMRGTINKDTFRDYAGKRIYCCCAGCPGEFDKHPGKYMKLLEEQEVPLEVAPGS